MPEEKEEQNAEEKFKISLLNLERKILDLEGLIADLSKKVKEVEKVKSEMEDLEDLTMVGNLAVIDLKKRVEEVKVDKGKLQSLINEVEALKNTLKPLKSEIEEIKKVLPMEEMKEKISFLENMTKGLSEENKEFQTNFSELNLTINKIKKDISRLEEEGLKKILSEITSIRSEMYKEIRGLKEQVEELEKKTSSVDIALLASKFNSLKENVDYLLNRKVEIDMKMKNLEESISKIMSQEFLPENIINDLTRISERTRSLEERMESLKAIVAGMGEKIKKVESSKISSEAPSSEILRRLKNVEEELKNIKEVRSETNLNEILNRIENLEKGASPELVSTSSLIKSEISEIKQKIKELEEQISTKSIEPKISEENFSRIANKINELEKRISKIEKSLTSGAIVIG